MLFITHSYIDESGIEVNEFSFVNGVRWFNADGKDNVYLLLEADKRSILCYSGTNAKPVVEKIKEWIKSTDNISEARIMLIE